MEEQGIIVLCSFVAISAVAYVIFSICDPYGFRIRSRVHELKENGTASRYSSNPSANADASMSYVWDFSGLLEIIGVGGQSKIQERLLKAGIYHPAALSRMLAARMLLLSMPITLFIVVGLSGYLRMETAILLGGLGAALGVLAPSLWLDRAISRHHALLRKSLPDFLDLMLVCLEGGLSLQETIRRVGEELRIIHPALAFELGVVQRDIELGTTVDQALKRFAERTDFDDARTLSTFIRESQRFGTNISEALRSHSDVLRMQREQAAEEKAQKASVKILLPTLILIFPAIFVVLVGPALIQIQESFATK